MIKNYKFNSGEVLFELRSEADESVFSEIFVDRDYRILDEVIKKARGPILDLGAHIGVFSVYAALQNSSVNIFAFEPDESNFQLLKENLKRNGIKNVTCKNLAISAGGGMRDFYLSDNSHNHSLILFDEKLVSKKVQTISLADIFLRYAKGKCDLVKMDIEGAEFEIIKNVAPEILKNIKSIYIEYHEYLPDVRAENLKEILQKNFFKVKIFPSSYDKRMGFLLGER